MALTALATGSCTGPTTATTAAVAVTPAKAVTVDQRARQLRLPPRGAGAVAGSTFIHRAQRLRTYEREKAMVDEILAGNVPAFQRTLVPLDVEATSAGGVPLRGRVFVLPDYLAIGSDEDFVRMPMTIGSARRIAREAGAVLPTPHLVDVIQAAAKIRVPSPYMTPGEHMGSIEYLARHNKVIEERRLATGIPLGALLSGPKKDLVITRRTLETPGRTPIYGWFAEDGSAIQSLSLVHDDRYADYAHGVRLVDAEMVVNDEPRPLLDVLADREQAALISREGPYDLRASWAKGW